MRTQLGRDRRRDIVRKTVNGLEAARARGRVGGRPSVVDPDKHRIILARHDDGESIRTIATATKVSIGTVHKVLKQDRPRHEPSETWRSQAQQAPAGWRALTGPSQARHPACSRTGLRDPSWPTVAGNRTL